MTTLTLDHNQRLNLIVMLDRLECLGRRETWAVCDLQKKLDLSDEERTAIGWRRMQNEKGQEFVMWNSNGASGPREYELPDDDVTRICNAVDKCPVVLGRDRQWWVPLVEQLPKGELMTKAKVKSHFSHKGKQYKPGDDFEGEEHEVQTLAQQGHVEHPEGQQAQGQGAQQQGPSKQQGQ